MRKFTLLILGAIISFGMFAQRPEVSIMKASVNPVIDGVIDDVWAEAGEEYNIELFGEDADPPTLGESGETTWQGLWTYDGIYVLLRVTDDSFYPHYMVPGSNSWEYDKPELYFDVNWDLEDGLGPMGGEGHYQVAPAFVEGAIDGTLLTCGFNGTDGSIIEHAALVEEPNYTAEYFIPWSSLLDKDGMAVDPTIPIGFDVTIIDRDMGDADNRGAVWTNVGTVGSSWENMDDCGIILMEGAGEGILIESISLTGGSIDKNNGTLQIEAEILPDEASNTNLNWTVINETGKASVDNDGVVTGIIDGEVKIKAESTDGSYVEAEAMVTITNQIVTMNEVNVIKNPNFDDPDGSAPSQWNYYSDQAPPPVVQSGSVVLQPQEAAENWQYSLSQSPLTAEKDIDYIFSFVAWADETKSFNVDFEDTQENNWNRYGASEDPRSGWGRSDWTFDVTDIPTKYVFDVFFDEIMDNTVQLLTFQMGTSGVVTYLDSIILVSVKDSARLTAYTPIEGIKISGEGDASKVAVGESLQMSAEILPAEADFPEVEWSVVAGDGQASIDENGLLLGEAAGLVTVVAMAMDDSEVHGEQELMVTWPAGIEGKKSLSLHIYPNPARDHIRVFFPEGCETARIFSSSGALMREVQVETQEKLLDISDLPAGVYFLRSGNSLGKFVK